MSCWQPYLSLRGARDRWHPASPLDTPARALGRRRRPTAGRARRSVRLLPAADPLAWQPGSSMFSSALCLFVRSFFFFFFFFSKSRLLGKMGKGRGERGSSCLLLVVCLGLLYFSYEQEGGGGALGWCGVRFRHKTPTTATRTRE